MQLAKDSGHNGPPQVAILSLNRVIHDNEKNCTQLSVHLIPNCQKGMTNPCVFLLGAECTHPFLESYTGPLFAKRKAGNPKNVASVWRFHICSLAEFFMSQSPYYIIVQTHTHTRDPRDPYFQGHKIFESKKNLGQCMSVLLCTKEQKRPAKSSSEQRRRRRVQRALVFFFFSFLAIL